MPDLLAALDAFLQEHRRCGDLDAPVEEGLVWMVCDCGAGIAHLGTWWSGLVSKFAAWRGPVLRHQLGRSCNDPSESEGERRFHLVDGLG
jgi:hypothetical protein